MNSMITTNQKPTIYTQKLERSTNSIKENHQTTREETKRRRRREKKEKKRTGENYRTIKKKNPENK